MVKANWVDVIEASYRVDQDEGSWLDGVLASAEAWLDHGLGLWGFTYDLQGTSMLRLRTPVARNLPPGGTLEAVMQAQAAVPPEDVARNFQTTTCGTASQIFGDQYMQKVALDRFSAFGVADTLGINVRDPTSTGCALIGILPEQGALSAKEVSLWKKVTAHIAAGFRLQRARRDEEPTVQAEAILTPGGKVEHAGRAAQSADARARLRAAVLAVESARGRLRRTSPEEAVDKWKGLVARRWTLVDRFETDGRRFVLARENAPLLAPPVDLTDREQQVMSYAALGHHNKLIAYELGVASSTVRVLVSRVAAKLGTQHRSDTVRAFLAMSRAFGPGDPV
jgi:DNA-binding CsgD family transcriptional regulator